MAEIRITEAIGVLDLRSVLWGTDPLRQWILRNVVDGRFLSEPTSDVEDSRPEYPHSPFSPPKKVPRDSV
jgi:hypothetical protein